MSGHKYVGKLSTPEGEIDITVYRSLRDSRWVVEVDTPGVADDEQGPLVRLFLNDAQVHPEGE